MLIVRGSPRTIGENGQVPDLSGLQMIGQWWPLEPHSHQALYGFSSKTPFLDILQSDSTSTFLRIIVTVRHHEHLPQRITLVHSTGSTARGVTERSCNILIAWNWEEDRL
jgi:hypothetical protein